MLAGPFLSLNISMLNGNSLASLLSSGFFCSLVSKFNKMYCSSVTRPSKTMYDTSSFSLGYGLSNASSTGPWDFLWAEKSARECSSVHPSALPSSLQKSKSTSAPLVGGRAVHINHGRPSPWPRESVETVGRLSGREVCEYDAVFCWCFDLHSHKKNDSRDRILLPRLIATGHQEQTETCPDYSPYQRLLFLFRNREFSIRHSSWFERRQYNQRNPPWRRCACLLNLLWILLRTLGGAHQPNPDTKYFVESEGEIV